MSLDKILEKIKKISLYSIIPISLLLSSCGKKPDYLIEINDSFRIDYEKMSNCRYSPRGDIENELKNYYSGAGSVALFFGAKTQKVKESFAGSWAYNNERIGVFNENLAEMDITPLINPKNQRPECFPVINLARKSASDEKPSYCSIDIYADKEWMKKFYDKTKNIMKISAKKVHKGIYMMNLKENLEGKEDWAVYFYSFTNEERDKMLVYISNNKEKIFEKTR